MKARSYVTSGQKISYLMTQRLLYLDNPKALLRFKRIIFRILKKYPSYLGSYLAYARILRDLKEIEEALRVYEFIENHSNADFRYHWSAYLCHGICLSEQKDYAASQAILEKIIYFDKTKIPFHFWPSANEQAKALNALSIIYAAQDKFDLMYKQLSAAVEIDPTYAPAWSGLGKYYSRSVNYHLSKAITCFEKAKALSPLRYKRLHLLPPLRKDPSQLQVGHGNSDALKLLEQTISFDLNSDDDFPKLPSAKQTQATSKPETCWKNSKKLLEALTTPNLTFFSTSPEKIQPAHEEVKMKVLTRSSTIKFSRI